MTRDGFPSVGDPATLCMWTDRRPLTVTYVSSTGLTLELREDDAKRIDNNGMSESQEYEYTFNPNGRLIKARLCKDGKYHQMPGGVRADVVRIGIKNKYHDYSF